MMEYNPQQLKNQRGAVLIISLIFLLILSLIGVSSMQGTSMQELMAGNLRDQYIAFNAAEAALLEGENQALTQYTSGTFGTDDMISGSHAASFALPTASTWDAEYVEVITAGLGVNAKELGYVVKVGSSSAGRTGTSDVQLESIYLIKK